MQTKRLTLDEYRKVNAVWLSNNRHNFSHLLDCQYYIIMYSHYLLAYGINIQLFEEVRNSASKFDEDINISFKIEEIISEYEAPIEHCHH